MNLDFLNNLKARSKQKAEAARAHLVTNLALADFYSAAMRALEKNPIRIAPYTKDYPEHLAALPPDFVRVPCVDEFSYFRLMRAAFSTGRTVINIEHDVIPTLEAVDELLYCDRPWCGYPTSTTQGSKVCLGFVKFDTARCRVMFEKYIKWDRLDGEIERMLLDEGLEPHVHSPEMVHINSFIPLYEQGEEHLEDKSAELMFRNLTISQEE